MRARLYHARMSPELQDVLTRRFGHAALRPWQAEVVDRLLEGKDSLVVMPTGSGKSLCYQLPALAPGAEGITLVFSPLIALMEDQVAALKKKGIPAVYINSTLSRAERDKRQEQIAQGRWPLVYATPERMKRPGFLEALDATPGGVRLLAVDEAHCISKWGHDLRPAYREVGAFRERLGAPPTIALTATATKRVRTDIRDVLRRSDDEMPLVHTSADRPNLTFACDQVWDDAEKIRKIQRIASDYPGTGIIYFALIKDIERMLSPIRRALPDHQVAIYHGKKDPRDKKRIYDRFIEAKPEDKLVLLATNAFGMGVDKPDIRFIVHAQVPAASKPGGRRSVVPDATASRATAACSTARTTWRSNAPSWTG